MCPSVETGNKEGRDDMKRISSKFLMIAAALVLSAGLSAVAQGAKGQRVDLVAGKAETVALPAAAADILVANPAVADVGSLRADRLFVVGRAVGDTNVLAFDAEGNQLADIAVHVRVDRATLEQSLRELFPKEKIEVDTVNNSIILKGSVSSPSAANQVRDLASRFIGAGSANQTLVDLMTVRGETQVMLKVKVMEIKRDLLREIGVDFDGTFELSDWGTLGLATVPGVGLTAPSPFGTGSIGIIQKGHLGPFDIGIQGLEQKGLINTLAEPTLVAISGETAGFLAGGEFPVPTGRDQDGNISLEFKQFGVSLNFIPTVLDNKRISLQLTSEVSEKSEADAVTLLNTIIPGLSVSRAQTTVQMSSGGTLMIAGLLKSRTVDGLSGLPGFKDIPILGELFKSKSFQRGESELVFLVTPYLVEPFADPAAERVASQDDNDLLQELLETGTTGAPVPVRAERPVFPRMMPAAPAAAPAKSLPGKTYYRRQGEEERSAGMKKASADQPRHPLKPLVHTAAAGQGASLVGAPLVSVDSAPLEASRQGLTLPVAGKMAALDQGPVSGAMPLPRRKPVMGEAPVPAVQEKAGKLAAKPDFIRESRDERTAGSQAVIDKRKSGNTAHAVEKQLEVAPSAPPEKQAAAALPEKGVKLAAATVPLPRRKPVVAERPLSVTFVNTLRKIYGNRVSATLGAGQSYGYIVE